MIDITWEDVAMKNILFFGDSNTYGYKPDKSGRYDYDVRWTGRIANLLGNEYNTNNMFWKTNGSQIIRIVDKYIVASTTIEKTDHFYVCNIESGHCSFVK